MEESLYFVSKSVKHYNPCTFAMHSNHLYSILYICFLLFITMKTIMNVYVLSNHLNSSKKLEHFNDVVFIF